MSMETCRPTALLTVQTLQIVSRPCKISAVTLNPGSAASVITLYDNTAGDNSGTVLAKLQGVANGGSVTMLPTLPIEANSGITAIVSGTAATGLVHITLL